MATRLNLGCGKVLIPGYINVDCWGDADQLVDLDVFPWPWASNSVDEIVSSHWLEHVDNYNQTILEMHRILKPGGVLKFVVPHFRSPTSIWHLHKWSFSVVTPQLLCQAEPYQFDGKLLFQKVSIRIGLPTRWPRLSAIYEWVANLNPLWWDTFSLPIKEVRFIGRKTGQDLTIAAVRPPGDTSNENL